MSKILITGGAGYIGSHTIVELIKKGFDVVSVDNYFNSIPLTYERIEALTGVKIPNYEIDLRNLADLRKIFTDHTDIKGVIHFGALKSVPDSVAHPDFCFDNNNNATNNIGKLCLEFGVKNIIFSSSCSVYGNVEPEDLPVTEATPLKRAESPYAYSKQNGEVMYRFMTDVYDLNVICLRYFNPVGAHPSGELGELPSKRVNNLVPVITQAAAGVRPHFTVFGSDWNTRDGSCIRDYIHVVDIAHAHIKGIELQLEGKTEGKFDIINLGNGDGVSVFEAINAFEKSSGVKAPYEVGPRRAGDVESIYSKPEKAKNVLGWEPQYSIDDMMSSAWKWQLKLEELGLNKAEP